MSPTKSWEDIEAELLQGQKLQGPSTCKDARPQACGVAAA